jgi:hypothetical protein
MAQSSTAPASEVELYLVKKGMDKTAAESFSKVGWPTLMGLWSSLVKFPDKSKTVNDVVEEFDDDSSMMNFQKPSKSMKRRLKDVLNGEATPPPRPALPCVPSDATSRAYQTSRI